MYLRHVTVSHKAGGRALSRREVRASADFYRIAALPTRTWLDPDLAELAARLTAQYKTRLGTMQLKPIQAWMLADFAEVQGLFAMVGVGKGKTLASMMLPCFGTFRRPLLLVPANLREKTYYDMRELARHWMIHPQIRVMTYEQLSGLDAESVLNDHAPDLIMADEAHKLKDRRTARTRRFLRFMRDNEGKVRFAAMSGSQFRRSIKELHHLAGLALPDENCPVPYHWPTVEDWGQALDPTTIAGLRPRPGVILQLAPDPTDRKLKPLEQARRSFRRRLTSTWGVVSTKGADDVEASLILRERKVKVPTAILEALGHIRETQETPNGDELEQAVDMWRHARELACGFWSMWEPAPPPEWLAARKAWQKHVREMLSLGRPGLDSPLQVALHFKEDERLRRWRAVREAYNPEEHKVAVWVDDFLVKDAMAWLEHHRGIVWVEHRAMGYALAEATGLRYYAGGDVANRDILTLTGRESIIASIKAHGTGCNLQMFAHSLITSCPPSSDTWEQLVGRLHRTGQKADEVIFDTYLHVPEILEGLVKTFEEARFVEETSAQQQRILYADKIWGDDVKKILAPPRAPRP